MSNRITIELSAEDRARLDRLAEAMERKTCDQCVNSALQWQEQVLRANENSEKTETVPEEFPAPPKPTQKVDRGKLRAKVIELSAKGMKEQAKEVVQAYAPTVAAVPEDQVTECYEKLVALEG